MRKTLAAITLALAVGCTTASQNQREQELAAENARLEQENRELRQGLSDIAAIRSGYDALVARANTAELRTDVARLRTDLIAYVDSSLAPIKIMVRGAVTGSERARDAASRLDESRRTFEEQAATISDINSSIANLRGRHYQLRTGIETDQRIDREIQSTRDGYQSQIRTLEADRAAYIRAEHTPIEKINYARTIGERIQTLQLQETAAIARILTAPQPLQQAQPQERQK